MNAAPKIGFVSLGCPKALTDSELILTQLSAQGYSTSKTFEGADLVIVNTCGFIDSAVQESLDAIAEALDQNGRVIVTGRPEHVKEIEALFQKLGPGKAKPQARETRLFTVPTAHWQISAASS